MRQCEIFDKNGEVREVLTDCKIPYSYKLEFPIEITDTNGNIRQSIDEVVVRSRINYGTQKKMLSAKDDASRVDVMLLSTTDLNQVTLNHLDAIDFDNINEIISVFFQSGRMRSDISG